MADTVANPGGDPLMAVDQAVAPLADQLCVTKAQLVLMGVAVAGLVALLTGVFDQKVKLQGSYGNNRVEALVPKGWLRKSGDMGWG